MKYINQEIFNSEEQNWSNSQECRESFSENEESQSSILLNNSVDTYENQAHSTNKWSCLNQSLKQKNNSNNKIPKARQTIQKQKKRRTQTKFITQILAILAMTEQYKNKRFIKSLFPYAMDEVKSILLQNQFLSNEEIEEIVDNFIKFIDGKLSFSTNNMNKVTRKYIEILTKMNAKTLLDYSTEIRKAYFYDYYRIGKDQFFENIAHKTTSDLRKYVEECKKKHVLTRYQLKNINLTRLVGLLKQN